MIQASIQMTGLKELKKQLAKLPKELQEGPIKSGLRGAASVLKKELVASAPHDPEADAVHINENIQVGRSRRKSGVGVETVTVGVKYGTRSFVSNRVKGGRVKTVKAKTEGVAWYWKLIEFGTSRIAKNPFMRPAFERSRKAMVDAFEKRLAAGIKRALRKLGAR